jgi:hypothetical protein
MATPSMRSGRGRCKSPRTRSGRNRAVAVAQAAIRAQAYRPVRSRYHDFLTTP